MDLTPTSLLYVSGSTGFKTGGVNQIPVGFSAPLTYGPEKIQAIQLGSKNRFFGNRVQVNAEVFHYDYEGYQTLGFVVLPGSILSFVTVNSQTAEFYGGEVESIFLPTANDRIDLSVSLLKARFLTFNVPSIGIQISGFDVPNAPHSTATLGVQHSFRLSNGASLIAHAEAHYTSSQWVDLLHGAGSHQESYTRSQADFSYEPASGKWRVTAWGRNLEDYGAISSYLYNVALQTQGVPLPPRTYGITATMNF
jgi:iron complex outermembrane receptor protein